MGDWDDDWETGAVTITKAENKIAEEDKVDTSALEKLAKEEAKKKVEEENRKKKEAEEAAKKKKGGPKAIVYNDQFNMPDTSAKLTKLKEKKHQKEQINDMFDGANHEFNEHLDNITLEHAEDFQDLGSLLGNKLCDPDFYLVHVEDFFKNLIDASYDKLTSQELKNISTKINVLLAKKQKEEKGGPQKKPNKAKGPTVVASKGAIAGRVAVGTDSEDDSEPEYAYKANFNEDDFI